MLIVRPIGGLCNRLRTIESTYKLALATGVELKVIWDIDSHSLHATFNSLFQPIDGIVVINNHIDSKIKRIFFEMKRYFFTKIYFFVSEKFLSNTIEEQWDREKMKYFFEDKAKKQDMFIESCWDFYPIERTYKLFKPVTSIQKEIDAFSHNINAKTIGIHIRRTDHLTAINESPLELFISKINTILNDDIEASFFLATDDKHVEETLYRIFKDKVISFSKNKSRISDAGVKEAVIDLFLLSKTSKIIGSFWSSFSMGAAELGGIELEVITKKQ